MRVFDFIPHSKKFVAKVTKKGWKLVWVSNLSLFNSPSSVEIQQAVTTNKLTSPRWSYWHWFRPPTWPELKNPNGAAGPSLFHFSLFRHLMDERPPPPWTHHVGANKKPLVGRCEMAGEGRWRLKRNGEEERRGRMSTRLIYIYTWIWRSRTNSGSDQRLWVLILWPRIPQSYATISLTYF